ncbi:hypothetical protein F4559_005557 [Saccharothrix violaceirubra]|uniref:Uncharacterized protein n=1 Tax=Saccharothrix violaceirubra TaxID=413306 RepID=A0A7W7T7W8_9PSEU|nr:hypothetical protein [Saccharothrix violaceirubra]
MITRTSHRDGPSHCGCPPRSPWPGAEVSLLADAGLRGGDAPGPTASAPRSGGEGERALVVGLGAYWFAMTLTVVSRLHRHASLESTHKVETVHPLVWVPLRHIITPRAADIIPNKVVGLSPPPGRRLT